MRRRLLGVFAHPDDEAYSAGGLLARCAIDGASVELLCATRGEAGTSWDPSLIGAGGLAALRTAELARSCDALGISAPRFLEWPDGGVAAMNLAARAEAIAIHLDRFRPHVVVTLGCDGAYGHTDHVAVTDAVTAAVASRPDVATRLLHCQFPRGLFSSVHRIMRRLGVALADGVGAERLGIDPRLVDLRLHLNADVEARTAKTAAVTQHRSQRPVDDPLSFLRPGLLEPLLKEEWYTVAAGPPLPVGCREPFAGL